MNNKNARCSYLTKLKRAKLKITAMNVLSSRFKEMKNIKNKSTKDIGNIPNALTPLNFERLKNKNEIFLKNISEIHSQKQLLNSSRVITNKNSPIPKIQIENNKTKKTATKLTSSITLKRENLMIGKIKTSISKKNRTSLDSSLTTKTLMNETFLKYLNNARKKKNEINAKSIKIKTRLKIKALITVVIISFAFYLILLFVQAVYEKYEDQIVKVAIIPMFSIFFVNFLIVEPIMLSVYSLLTYFVPYYHFNTNKTILGFLIKNISLVIVSQYISLIVIKDIQKLNLD